MPVLNIRLSKEVHSRLRLRAARAGRSMEAEARILLAAACTAKSLEPPEVQDWVAKLYRGKGKKPRRTVESLIAERRRGAIAPLPSFGAFLWG